MTNVITVGTVEAGRTIEIEDQGTIDSKLSTSQVLIMKCITEKSNTLYLLLKCLYT